MNILKFQNTLVNSENTCHNLDKLTRIYKHRLRITAHQKPKLEAIVDHQEAILMIMDFLKSKMSGIIPKTSNTLRDTAWNIKV